jgi:hypothetical protein
MLSEVAYNRRATNIPHVAIQINSVIGISDFYNNESLDTDYTIPSIELQSAVVSGTTQTGPILLDTGKFLDESWTLDEIASTEFSATINDFVYFVAGIGKKGLLSKDFPVIFDDAFLHIPFSDPDTTLAEDVTNNYVGTITGNFERVTGVIGKSLDYQIDTYISIPAFIIPSASDFTLNFWLKIVKEDGVTNDKCREIFSYESLDICYKEDTFNLIITMYDGTNTYTKEVTYDVRGEDLFCQFELDYINETLNIYYNNNLEDVLDLTGNLGFDSNNSLTIGSKWDDETNIDYMFKGLIDELSMHSSIFSTDEKTFLYDSKFGDHTYLGNTVYRIALTSEEKSRIVTNREYFLLQGIAKGNTVNDELVFTGDGSTDTFDNITNYQAIKKGSMKLSFLDTGDSNVVVVDDKNGNLVGSKTSGDIDYTTGAFTLNFFKDINNNNIVYSGLGNETTVNFSIDPIVETNSFKVTHVYLGLTYEGIDNGIGSIIGTNISSGTINYSTGAVSITFTNATDIDTPLRYSYTNRLTDILGNLKEVKAEYQTVDDLELTECGYENSLGKLVQYTSFPKCKFGTPNASLVNNTIIKAT